MAWGHFKSSHGLGYSVFMRFSWTSIGMLFDVIHDVDLKQHLCGHVSYIFIYIYVFETWIFSIAPVHHHCFHSNLKELGDTGIPMDTPLSDTWLRDL